MGRVGVPIPTIHAVNSDALLRYRARARMAVTASHRAVVVGFRGQRSHRVVPVDACVVLVPALDQVRGQLAAWLEGSVGEGEASLYQGHGALPAIHLTWTGTLAPRVFALAQEKIDKGCWAGVSVLLEGARSPAVLGDPTGVAMGVDGQPLLFPPGGFTQANEAMNRVLVQHVAALTSADEGTEGDRAGGAVLELFAGSGNFTIALARRTSGMEAVEQSAAAVDATRGNLARRGLECRLRVGDATDVRIRNTVRTVVLDPPRAGAREAVERIADSRVRNVVMVSCDPATLARDVAILHGRGRFNVERVDVFEMFPCTSHVETVALLRRAR